MTLSLPESLHRVPLTTDKHNSHSIASASPGEGLRLSPQHRLAHSATIYMLFQLKISIYAKCFSLQGSGIFGSFILFRSNLSGTRPLANYGFKGFCWFVKGLRDHQALGTLLHKCTYTAGLQWETDRYPSKSLNQTYYPVNINIIWVDHTVVPLRHWLKII